RRSAPPPCGAGPDQARGPRAPAFRAGGLCRRARRGVTAHGHGRRRSHLSEQSGAAADTAHAECWRTLEDSRIITSAFMIRRRHLHLMAFLAACGVIVLAASPAFAQKKFLETVRKVYQLDRSNGKCD